MPILFSNKLSRIRTKRASIIPYTIVTSQKTNRPCILFLLARDRVAHQWTDFGGGVKKNEMTLNAAFREFSEESKEIFLKEYPSCNSISTCVAWTDEDKMNGCVFVPVHAKWVRDAKAIFDVNSELAKYKNRRCYNEVDDIRWFSQTEFHGMIYKNQNHLWSKCKDTFKQFYNEKFCQFLHKSYQQHFP